MTTTQIQHLSRNAPDAPVAGLSARYVADGAAYIDGKIQSALAPVKRAILEVNTNV